MLFASDAPTMSQGAHRAYLDYADIPLAARRKIAGGNLRRLLGGHGPDATRPNPNEDPLMRAVRLGRPLPVPAIDFHMHFLDEGLNGAGGGHRMWRGDPQGIFAINRRLGVGGGAAMSWAGPVSVDAVGGNAAIARALDLAPPGYFGAPTLDPVHYPAAEFAAQIRTVYADARMIGMKPYPRYGVAYTDPRFAPWWEFGNEREFYALIHRTRADFSEVDTLAKKYPRVRWVATHIGASFAVADQSIESMKRHANTFAELTLTSVTLGVIEHLVEHAGADRVLYGSDQSMRDPRQQLGWVVFARLPLETKLAILARNALRVLAPVMPRLPEHNRPPSL